MKVKTRGYTIEYCINIHKYAKIYIETERYAEIGRKARKVENAKIESRGGVCGTDSIRGHGVETVCGVQI